jgi:hypothetical protein
VGSCPSNAVLVTANASSKIISLKYLILNLKYCKCSPVTESQRPFQGRVSRAESLRASARGRLGRKNGLSAACSAVPLDVPEIVAFIP